MNKEDLYLRAGLDLVISDSPLLMVGAYSIRDNHKFASHLIELSKIVEEVYPSLNIFLQRDDIEYQQEGRYETYEQAIKMDNFILDVMKEHLPQIYFFKTSERADILEFIKNKLS